MMKRRVFIMLLMLVAAMTMSAQNFEGIDDLYRIFGDSHSFPDATVAVVSGKSEKKLAANKLDFFKSVSVTDEKAMAEINAAALDLSKLSVDTELSSSAGVINYAFFSFEPIKRRNRYMFFFYNGKKAVAMYMEGSASFDDIKKMIKK